MTTTAGAALPPGATIGILGGGQLGRMAAQAAAQLGYRCHVFCPDSHAPAYEVSAERTVAAYDDDRALAAFAEAVDLVTFEFENLPAQSAALLADRVLVRPRPEVLAICQDRLREKATCRRLGVATAAFREVDGPAALEEALAAIGRPAVLKTTRWGYDGKGQAMIGPGAAAEAAWAAIGRPSGAGSAILEAQIDFAMEASVIVARGPDGVLASYAPVENRHRHHILARTIAPARLEPGVATEARAIAERLAEGLDLVGLLAVEMFVTRDGALLVNELAPRPHNSGHWTLDAAATSQFEQFIRAVAGLPLGATAALCPAVMRNLLGDEALEAQRYLAQPWTKLHLYGKAEARPGRKMGHVTRLFPGQPPGEAEIEAL